MPNFKFKFIAQEIKQVQRNLFKIKIASHNYFSETCLISELCSTYNNGNLHQEAVRSDTSIHIFTFKLSWKKRYFLMWITVVDSHICFNESCVNNNKLST